MKIDPTSEITLNAQQRRVQSEREVQHVFAAVLADAGQAGYASADCGTMDCETPQIATCDEITSCWDDWLSVAGNQRYTDQANPQQTLDDFNALMLKAYEAKAYAAPQAFLSGLDESQLETIQHVQRLANPINVQELTEEGALNLLLPPPAQVDLNFDGLTQTGKALGIKFPDSRTPKDVADAWYEATASLSPMDRAHRELQMKMPVLLANIHVDGNGRFTHQTEPGDPAWVNPLASPDYSYLKQTQDMLDSLEYFKNQTPPNQYQSGVRFWSKFQAELIEHKAK